MIDYAKITIKAGDGGRGAGSRIPIRRKKYGKANGGDGGSGGNVVFKATNDARGLDKYRFEHFFKAKNGEMGSSNLRRGATAEDLILKVPLGTQIKVTNTDYSFDLTSEGQQVLIAKGGGGGKGNAHLKDEFGRRPYAGNPGDIGEQLDLTLELKLIADVGLIGLPNAGKSTLISKLTAAKPEIAPYPFTTLEPNLGVLDSSHFTVHSSQKKNYDESSTVNREPLTINKTLVFADIPGLIEGASEGKGLGDLFLKHIIRTKILAHLIDLSGGNPENLWQQYQTIRTELKNYSPELAKKREIVVLNKSDLVDEQISSAVLKLFSDHRKKAFVISAEKQTGLTELVREIVKKIK